MKRKNKIIFSLTGITIIMLALLGFTYGYYLTNIYGNTNTNSISISTADLKLVYEDGSSNIETKNLEPGANIPTKTFIVKNEGSSTIEDYVVSIEDVINTLTRIEDFTYKLTCVQKNKSGYINGECLSVSGEYPKENSMIILNSIESGYTHEYSLKLNYVNLPDVNQSIDMGSTIQGKVQIYSLADTIDISGNISNYEEGDYIQIYPSNKTSDIVDGRYKIVGLEPGVYSLNIKNGETIKSSMYFSLGVGEEVAFSEKEVTISNGEKRTVKDIKYTAGSRTLTININDNDLNFGNTISNYNPFIENTLAYNLFDSALVAKYEKDQTKTIYNTLPLSKVGVEVSGEDETTLSLTEDDYGISYYYRGNVDDNYVNFAGMCWRVVRIEGNGNVKMILEDSTSECSSTMIGNWSVGSGPYGYFYKNVVSSSGESSVSPVYIAEIKEGDGSQSLAIALSMFTLSNPSIFTGDKVASNKSCVGNMTLAYSTSGVPDQTPINDLMYHNFEFVYESVARLERFSNNTAYPTLKCEKNNNKISTEIDAFNLLSIDELVYSGLCLNYACDVYSSSSFIINNNFFDNNPNAYFWTSSLSNFDGYGDYVYAVKSSKGLGSHSSFRVDSNNHYRPVISIANNITISNDSGNGTIDDPYVIN